MIMEHDFTHPRNLYEKLERDAILLEEEASGDNFFNFIATACHLQQWIKQEDGLRSDAAVTRLLKKLHDEPKIKLCEEILEAKKSFKIIRETESQIFAKIDEEVIDVNVLKERVMNLYNSYFRVK